MSAAKWQALRGDAAPWRARGCRSAILYAVLYKGEDARVGDWSAWSGVALGNHKRRIGLPQDYRSLVKALFEVSYCQLELGCHPNVSGPMIRPTGFDSDETFFRQNAETAADRWFRILARSIEVLEGARLPLELQ